MSEESQETRTDTVGHRTCMCVCVQITLYTYAYMLLCVYVGGSVGVCVCVGGHVRVCACVCVNQPGRTISPSPKRLLPALPLISHPCPGVGGVFVLLECGAES